MYKYLAVSNEIENMIKSGRYKEGERIPSIRSLTQNYNCNKSTVISALSELERKHIVYSLPKSGYYVVTRKPNLIKGEKLILNFSSSAPDPEVFPYIDFQHCINQAIDIYKNDLFIYGTPKGLSSLIDVIQKQLANYQVFTNKKNIFITSGVQQALSILAAIPFPNNKETILIEQPGYHLFIDYLETHKVPVVGIERTSEGIDMLELERIFKSENIKFFYTMPRYHNPLGTSYSQEKKKKILELAKKYDVYIVEDDYLSDFEQNLKADPIFSYDSSSYVIYLKSYSKIIFPGLRIGIAVIPESIIERFSKYKSVLDIDSSMLSQAALEIYIKSGMFERHKEKIKASYLLRAKCLTSLLEKKIDSCNHIYKYSPLKNICIHTYIELDKEISCEKLINRLKKKSIIVDTADNNYLSSFPIKKSILKINVSNVAEDYIDEGINEIIQEIECLSRKNFV
ncbi:PLP-dependent aminotransferase family protein [Clostridium sp. OS1-26]|uniref:aminotransferase-like domain-containing protein n=1 Tax=Clostridium sp. OS1-26 TaxID=3070681 RepID=UPI0027E1A2D8|nr:PLP-dependent aminotransferase family protein [Clostridium sp. OS1-26]WML37574.1 PLP-dependent aminotransferase family protein [Clostridium sp. OS1-26]